MTFENFRLQKPRAGFYIPIIGCIASGKSSLCHALARSISEDTGKPCREFLEPAATEDGMASKFLPLFYNDPPRWAFAVQVEMLTTRRKQTRLAQLLSYNGEHSVSDSAYEADSVFVSLLEKRGEISHAEADLYFELFHQMSEDVLYPQAFVYLSVNPDTAKKRLDRRMSEKAGRVMESGIKLDYLTGLINEYDQLTANLSRFSHVIKLDWNSDKTPEEIEVAAKNLWYLIKSTEHTSPIPCQLGLSDGFIGGY